MPKLRNKISTDSLAILVNKWLRETGPADLFVTCATCKHLATDQRMCDKYKIVPPVRVVIGEIECAEYWDAEEIPF